jgi:serine/alanine adding enzyme
MIKKSHWELLSYADPNQRLKWQYLCDTIDNIDVYFYPEYARLFELHGDGEPYLFVYYESSNDWVIYPFLKRSLTDVFENKHINKDLFDITSPYGYNGYLRNKPKINMEDFYYCFHRYCASNNIVSEFVRFHPLLNNILYSPREVTIIQERETIVIDLTQGHDQIWSSIQSSCRNKIRKAIKNDIRILQDDEFSEFETFYKLYVETMNRLNANSYYFFSRQWFYSLLNLIKKNTVLFHAYHSNDIVNSALFIFNNTYIHYYLSGSLFQKRNLAANNLLLYEVALWAKSKGIKYFHLGGGYQPNDTLSQFKSSFSPYKTKFYIGGVIHRPESYEYLCDLRMQKSLLKPNSNYFPLYRVPKEY